MDISRSRARLGSSSHMVKTYGRFRQRMVNRDVMGTDDFARITGIKPILSEMMDSSSESDFEAPKAPPTPNRTPVKAKVPSRAVKEAPKNKEPRSRANSTARKGTAIGKSRQTKSAARDKKTTSKPASTRAKTNSRKKLLPEPNFKVDHKTPSEPEGPLERHGQVQEVSLPLPVDKVTNGTNTMFVNDELTQKLDVPAEPTASIANNAAEYMIVASSKENSNPFTELNPVSKAKPIDTSEKSPYKPQRSIVSEHKESRLPESPLSSGKVTRRRTNPRTRKSNRPMQSHSTIQEENKPEEENANNNSQKKSPRELSRRVSQISIADQADVQMKESNTNTDGVSNTDNKFPGCAEPREYESNGEYEKGSDEEYASESGQNRQLLATRAMRFKAPKDARPQTVDLDDNDIEMQMGSVGTTGNGDQQDERMAVDSQEPEAYKRLSASLTQHEHTQQYTQEAFALHTQTEALNTEPSNGLAAAPLDSEMPVTPSRSNRRISARLTPAALHSPSRVVTPHRVVYSPARPMTTMRPRFDPISISLDESESSDISSMSRLRQSLDLDNQKTLLEPESAPSQQRIDDSRIDEKQRASPPLVPQHRLSTDSVENRRNTTSEVSNEPDIEETTVPFLPARRYVQKTHILAACGQTAPIDWSAGGLQACGVLLPNLDSSEHTEKQMGEIESKSGLCKIGEATYSEVFSAQWKYVPKTRYDRFNSKKGDVKGERIMQVALKVIPFGNTSVKSGTGEPQTTLRDLYQEIGATLALSRLSERERAKLQEARMQVKMPLKPKERELGANFVKAFRVCICKGSLPTPLLRAWDRWKAEYPDLCENVRPDYYPESQLFAVFVLEMGGETLENAAVSTWKEARSIIRQLALSMALAERNSSFEHRDLHWGNIMVTRYNSNLTFLYQLPPLGSRVKSTLISIPSYKVRCTIIDYTLSRLHIDNDASDTTTTTKPTKYDPLNNVFYVALKDESLFQGKGDIQFDVYRQMREWSKDDWAGFYPHTNVLWLTYVLHKILMTKSSNIKNELLAFAQSKIGPAFDSMAPEIKSAAGQELLRRWIQEFEQCETSSQVLKCALLDLYKS
ncbi:hypothetical protein IW138_001268 [Coemansia sp. RSA 986]|nr:hypothetical protein IW138_001268 [Coemansia sp. RSA 986]